MSEIFGYLLTIDAIITWGLASLVYKYGLRKTNAQATLLSRLLIVTLSTFVLSLFLGNYSLILELNNQELFDYVVASIISGISVTVGDLMYFYSLKKIDASRAFPLTALSLVFVYPFSALFFGEQITIHVLVGGILMLSSVVLISSKDKADINSNKDLDLKSNEINEERDQEDLLIGVILALGTAFFWALSIVSFNQARIVSNDVFITNFVRIIFATIFIAIVGLFNKEYYGTFKKENRSDVKYYLYIGIAASLSLGFADSLFYMAAEINGLIITSTITACTPLVQQIFAVLILKEKFRKRIIIGIILIIAGNYIIIFW